MSPCKMKTIFTTVILLTGLTGCSTSNNSISKIKDTITVDIINQASKDQLTAIYFEESYDCFNAKPIVTNSTANNVTLTLEKKPYQTISFQYLSSAFDGANFHPKSCSGTYTFRADESYTYTVILGNFFNTCDIEVRRDLLSPSDFLVQKIRLNSRQTKEKPRFSNGPWCEAVEAFKG